MIATDLDYLIKRIGSEHIQRRLEIESQHEAQLFGQGTVLFNFENWKLAPRLVKLALKATGLYAPARRNADRIIIRRNIVTFNNLPKAFDRCRRGVGRK